MLGHKCFASAGPRHCTLYISGKQQQQARNVGQPKKDAHNTSLMYDYVKEVFRKLSLPDGLYNCTEVVYSFA